MVRTTAIEKAKSEKRRKASRKAKKTETPQQSEPPRASMPSQPQKMDEKTPETKPSEMAPIKADEFDFHFKNEITKKHGGEKLKQCFQCGTCTSDCPIARFSESYRPRQIIRMAQLGLKKRVLSSDSLWLCAACFTCTDRCPQNVEVAGVIRVLRNAAVEEGFMPLIFRELGLSILESCVTYKIPELRLKKRAESGLPPLPKVNPEAMAKLAKATGFMKTIKGETT